MTRDAGPTYCWRSVLYFSRGGGARSVGLRGAWALTEQEQGSLSFAGLLRLLRGEAKLTQEDLAEAAGLSLRAVSDLERGIHRTARKDTALQLAGALLRQRARWLLVFDNAQAPADVTPWLPGGAGTC
jgi:DNA-binding XRE family transcriptional regulator